VLPEEPFEGMFAEHSYASSTPVSDGERVYVYFGRAGALAFDLDGNRLWQTSVGTEFDPRHWGSASSPILYKDVLIVTATAESEAIVGLDTRTGQELWRQEAQGFGGTWGTPVLAKVDETRTDLVLGVPFEMWGLSPENGKLRWYCEAIYADTYCASVVVERDVVYAIEGRAGGSIAIRAGGKGDVAQSHIIWTGTSSSQIKTPIVYDGRIYYFSRGIANCIDAKTGKRVFRARLERGSSGSSNGGGSDYSSPVIADGKVYFVSRSGNMFVLTAGKSFEQLAVNRVTDDLEDFSATPAISDGQLFIRSSKHLYCIAGAGK